MKAPYATIILILLAVGAYVTVSEGQLYVYPETKLYSLGVSQRNIQQGNIHTILTYSFMHIGFKHLLVNMSVLLAIGFIAERKIGLKHLLSVFFFSEIIAGIAYAATVPTGWVIGSSAGIAGVMVASYLSDVKKTLIVLIAISIFSFAIAMPMTDLTLKSITEEKEKVINQSQEEITELNETIKEVQKEIQEKQEKGENTSKETAEVKNLSTQLNKTREIKKTAEKQKKTIQEGEKKETQTPPSNLIHMYGALSGVAYMMIFKREAFEWFIKDMKDLSKKIRKKVRK